MRYSGITSDVRWPADHWRAGEQQQRALAGVLRPLVTLVRLHRALQHELVELHRDAVAADVHGAHARRREARHHADGRAVHHELAGRRRSVITPLDLPADPPRFPRLPSPVTLPGYPPSPATPLALLHVYPPFLPYIFFCLCSSFLPFINPPFLPPIATLHFYPPHFNTFWHWHSKSFLWKIQLSYWAKSYFVLAQ